MKVMTVTVELVGSITKRNDGKKIYKDLKNP